MMRRFSRFGGVAQCSLAITSTAHRKASSSNSMPYFDAIDKLWNGPPSSAAAAAAASSASNSSSTTAIESWVVAAQSNLGMEPWLCLMGIGFAFRVVSLVFSLYSERAAERMQALLPIIKPQFDKFQRIRETGRESAVVAASIELKADVRHLYKSHGTSNLKAAAGVLGSPLVLYGFASVSKLCSLSTGSVGSSSFLWCPALVWPDPFYVLPVVSVALTLLNFEAALRLRKTMNNTWMDNVVWGARASALIGLSAVSQVSSGVLLYWIGLNLGGLLQPLLLRSARFRRLFKFPDVKSLQSSPMDPLQARVALRVPMLRELYDPQLEEDLDPKRATKDFSQRR